jgi:hypothetical protein
MTRRLVVLAVIASLALMMSVTPAAADPPSCNWGTLTADAIAGGFPQGPHSSDPSGDGHGPGTADEPRVGLANVVERGNLHATCELISSLLP